MDQNVISQNVTFIKKCGANLRVLFSCLFINIKNKRREASFIPEGFTGATERGAENPCEKRTDNKSLKYF